MSETQFDALTDEELFAYERRLRDGWPGGAAASPENEVQVECARRWFELMQWVFPDADEYERQIGNLVWRVMSEKAEQVIKALEPAAVSPDLSASEQQRARQLIAEFQTIVDMKRDLSAIPDTPEP